MRRTLIEAAALTMARAGGDASDNEDSVRYAAGKGHPDAWADFVAVVADGVGTSREPAAAGRAAVETWLQFLERRFTERPEDLAAFDEVQFEHLLRECFAQAHRQVQRLAPGGSATAAGVCIQGPWLLAATVGDARAYHLTEGILHQLTEDQVDSGGNPTDVLGGRAVSPVAAGYAKASISPGDWIVACSDGVIKTLSPEALAALLRAAESPQTAVKALKERVRAQKVDDDVTAVFARVDQVGEPFWAGTGDRGSGIGGQGSGVGEGDAVSQSFSGATANEPPSAPRRKGLLPGNSPTPDPRSLNPDKEGAAMRNDTDMLELERRLERLERSPNGGTLSQQENARLEREFNRLEGQIRDAEERVAQASRAPVWWVLAALVVGLALGAIVSAEMVRVMSGGSRARTLGSGSDAAGMALQTPADMAAPMESRVTDEAVVLRYRTKTGEQKVAIFPYALSGKPSVTYRLPPVQSARNYGKTESGSDSEPATPRRTAPRRGSD